MDYEGDAPQEYEQIPWSHLVPVQRDRSMQVAMAAVAIVAALLAAVFFVRRGPAAGPPALPTSSNVPVSFVGEAAPASSPPEAAPVPAPPVLEPQIYSEADLMATLPPQPELAAIARAEWFVTDYFTVDGDSSLADAVAAALPDAVELPVGDGSQISYVEWARAVAISDHRDGRFDVTVWFRTLVGNGDEGFARTPVRAVEVRLVTDGEGRLAIADLPGATEVAALGVAPQWPDRTTAPPDAVARASDRATAIGDAPELLTTGVVDDGWRLVFTIGDASGLRFPIAVHVP